MTAAKKPRTKAATKNTVPSAADFVGEVRPVEIYGLTCPETGRVRYVGKANDSVKRFKSHTRDARRTERKTPVYCWFRSLAVEGKQPGMVVLETVPHGEDWRQVEMRLIAEHRALGKMLNVADGGDEPHCPTKVRAGNGVRNAKKRNHVIWTARRFVGQEAWWMEEHGSKIVAERLRHVLFLFDTVTPETRMKMAQRIVGMNHGAS